MRKYMPVKFLSYLLLAVISCAFLSGACESAHAMERGGSISVCELSASHAAADCDTPDCPLQDETQHGDCDFCCDCACHASLSGTPFSLNYSPIFAPLQTFDSFTFLPEVFLSKFVPPQLNA